MAALRGAATMALPVTLMTDSNVVDTITTQPTTPMNITQPATPMNNKEPSSPSFHYPGSGGVSSATEHLLHHTASNGPRPSARMTVLPGSVDVATEPVDVV